MNIARDRNPASAGSADQDEGRGASHEIIESIAQGAHDFGTPHERDAIERGGALAAKARDLAP